MRHQRRGGIEPPSSLNQSSADLASAFFGRMGCPIERATLRYTSIVARSSHGAQCPSTLHRVLRCASSKPGPRFCRCYMTANHLRVASTSTSRARRRSPRCCRWWGCRHLGRDGPFEAALRGHSCSTLLGRPVDCRLREFETHRARRVLTRSTVGRARDDHSGCSPTPPSRPGAQLGREIRRNSSRSAQDGRRIRHGFTSSSCAIVSRRVVDRCPAVPSRPLTPRPDLPWSFRATRSAGSPPQSSSGCGILLGGLNDLQLRA